MDICSAMHWVIYICLGCAIRFTCDACEKYENHLRWCFAEGNCAVECASVIFLTGKSKDQVQAHVHVPHPTQVGPARMSGELGLKGI